MDYNPPVDYQIIPVKKEPFENKKLFILSFLSLFLIITNIKTPSLRKYPIAPENSEKINVQIPKPQVKALVTEADSFETLFSSPPQEGYVINSLLKDNKSEIKIGRNDFETARGFVSFKIPDSLESNNIHKAVLRLYQYRADNYAYEKGNQIIIDHLLYGATLNANDFYLPAETASIATLSSDKNSGWKEAEVTSAFIADLREKRAFSQYRIRFDSEQPSGSMSELFARFYSSHTGFNFSPPELLIVYR